MFDSLNQPQSEAVQSLQGPLLVLAGAGTGKTKVLTSRIIHIINSQLAYPSQILAVTFTNKAAAEMRHRIGDVIGDEVNNLWVGTFHSIAAKIARRNAEVVGLKSDFTIIDQDDQTRLIKRILADLEVDIKQYPAKNYLNKISRAKDVKVPNFNAQGEAEGGINFADSEYDLPKIGSVFRLYQSRLKAMNAVDFGDLLLLNLEIFARAPEVLAYYQDKFHYVLVDEYQDTNNVQYQWLLKLVASHNNLCAVGDDDQSIYSWRGANIANILRFEKDFKDAKIIRLEQNYRSTAEILEVADSIISHNKERHGKKLWTDKKGGQEVRLFSFLDDRAEAKFAVKMAQEYGSKNKYKLSQMAILVRAGFQTRSFEEAFIRASIPYRIIGGLKFYERMEIKDAICYLRIVCNENDDLAFGRIVNVPKRGIGQTTLDNIYEKVKNEGGSMLQAVRQAIASGELKGKAKEGFALLVAQIDRWRKMLETNSLGDAARIILEESGYMKMWQAENSIEAQGRLENIDEFVGSLGDFENIIEFLEYVSLVEAKEEKQGVDSIAVMTVHGAKGLEFDFVMVPGLEDGVFPSGRSVEEKNGEEEERRLFYVAITRAKKELVLCNAKTRFVFGDYQQSLPSRFLKELPKHIKIIEDGYDDENQSVSYGGARSYANGGVGYSGGSSFGGAKNSGANFSQKSVHGQMKFVNFEKTTQKVENAAKKNFDQSDSLFGKRMFHQKFGYGKVIGIDGTKLEIAFEKTGKKTVMRDFVTLA